MRRLEITLGAEARAERADRALARNLPELPGWRLRQAFAQRDVKCNGKRIAADALVSAGDVLHVYTPEAGEPLRILFEDDAYAVIDKRQGMPTQGEGSVEAAFARQTGRVALACHRLDVQTGGLLLLAKGEASRQLAEEAFAEHRVEKIYQAEVCGHPTRSSATLKAYLRKDSEAARVRIYDAPVSGALPIETRYRTLAIHADTALLEIMLVTGRTHQIRAHLAHIGHPVLGDDKYGNRAVNRAHNVRRQRLWATRLTLWDGRRYETTPQWT